MFSASASNSLSLSLATNPDSNLRNQQKRKFLQFQLGKRKQHDNSTLQGDISLLDTSVVTEVITISSEDILPVPQLFYCVLGVYGWRSEMLWIVDLENLLGYPPPMDGEESNTQQEYLVMVVQFQGQSIGLVVSGIDNLIEHDIEQFKPPSPELLIDAEEIFHFFSIKTEFNYSR